MRHLRELRQRLRDSLHRPLNEVGRLGRFLRYQARLWQFCFQRLREGNVFSLASALSFQTLFALVPILMLASVLLQTYGLPVQWQDTLRSVLHQTGISKIRIRESVSSKAASAPTQPAGARVSVALELEDVGRVVQQEATLRRVGPLGVLVLAWGAMALLIMIDRSLNQIFQTRQGWRILQRVPLYLLIVLVWPPILSGFLVLSSWANRVLKDVGFFNVALQILARISPFLAGVALLAGIYKLIPSTRVRYRHALAGAAVALPLWLLAKWGLGRYVEFVATRSVLGALALMPLFLVWLNFSWGLFLFGAELTHVAGNLPLMQKQREREARLLGPWELLAGTVLVDRIFRRERRAARLDELAQQLILSEPTVAQLMEELVRQKILQPVDSQRTRFLLCRDLGDIQVREFFQPHEGIEGIGAVQTPLAGAVKEIHDRIRMGVQELSLREALPD